MDITALFPSPVATFFDFITEEERLQIFESIMSVEHPPHGAITGKGFSTHTTAVQEDVRSSTIVSSKITKDKRFLVLLRFFSFYLV